MEQTQSHVPAGMPQEAGQEQRLMSPPYGASEPQPDHLPYINGQPYAAAQPEDIPYINGQPYHMYTGAQPPPMDMPQQQQHSAPFYPQQDPVGSPPIYPAAAPIYPETAFDPQKEGPIVVEVENPSDPEAGNKEAPRSHGVAPPAARGGVFKRHMKKFLSLIFVIIIAVAVGGGVGGSRRGGARRYHHSSGFSSSSSGSSDTGSSGSGTTSSSDCLAPGIDICATSAYCYEYVATDSDCQQACDGQYYCYYTS